jgi:uncharacterized protein (DUF2141 family)
VDSLTRIPLLQGDYTLEKNLTGISLVKKVDLKVLFPPDSSSMDQQKSKSPKTSKPKKNASIIFAKSALISIENDTAQALDIPITINKLESTAIIETKVQTSENFIIQLLSKAGKIVEERINQKDFIFENLPPDTYLLRIAIDGNKNGKWDPGDYRTKSEPEPIVYYRNTKGLKEIPLKANWVVGPLLITY